VGAEAAVAAAGPDVEEARGVALEGGQADAVCFLRRFRAGIELVRAAVPQEGLVRIAGIEGAASLEPQQPDVLLVALSLPRLRAGAGAQRLRRAPLRLHAASPREAARALRLARGFPRALRLRLEVSDELLLPGQRPA